jgi:hypothetical protein
MRGNRAIREPAWLTNSPAGFPRFGDPRNQGVPGSSPGVGFRYGAEECPVDGGLATAFLSPVAQEGLGRLESLQAITAEICCCLRKVDQVRAHVHRELGGAEVEQKGSGHRIFSRRPVLGEALQRRLDAPQTPDVGERPGDGATLGSFELAWRRAFRRSGRRDRGRMPAAAAAAGRRQREHGDCEREGRSRRRRITARR